MSCVISPLTSDLKKNYTHTHELADTYTHTECYMLTLHLLRHAFIIHSFNYYKFNQHWRPGHMLGCEATTLNKNELFLKMFPVKYV